MGIAYAAAVGMVVLALKADGWVAGTAALAILGFLLFAWVTR